MHRGVEPVAEPVSFSYGSTFAYGIADVFSESESDCYNTVAVSDDKQSESDDFGSESNTKHDRIGSDWVCGSSWGLWLSRRSISGCSRHSGCLHWSDYHHYGRRGHP
jgi:hypothetical protein